ncbi:hypothetical protein SmJEL517_g04604 [Synchytrium microbalum]|uniref:VPS9 domain-containing protein n=1 Tax=Synchytrium microbalum TaxID=1806994 RepID=A0A507C418_9FUNG|nr:uncharacterized protein SmJEL517_g04604 [Synchytrium microbalum]TPX32263.1 hypothetical protein SmJEL517_g04604 [Synchytrium microbalum]
MAFTFPQLSEIELSSHPMLKTLLKDNAIYQSVRALLRSKRALVMLPVKEACPTTISRLFIEAHAFLVNAKNTHQLVSLAGLKATIVGSNIVFTGRTDVNMFNLSTNATDLASLFEHFLPEASIDINTVPHVVPISENRYLHALEDNEFIEVILMKRSITEDDGKPPGKQTIKQSPLQQPSYSILPSFLSRDIVSRNGDVALGLEDLPAPQDAETTYFLDTVKTPSFTSIQLETSKFLLEMEKSNKQGFTSSSLELLIRLFFERMNRSLSESAIFAAFRDHDEDGVRRMMSGLSTYVLTRCHDLNYESVLSDTGRSDDEVFARRVSVLNVIGFDLEELGLVVHNRAALKDLVKAAGIELTRFERARCPQQKLSAVVRAHRCIAEAIPLLDIHEMDDDPLNIQQRKSNADDMLPVFIYVLHRVNIPHLKTNQRYVLHFCPPINMAGDASYCWTNFCAAISFLESFDLRELGLDAEILAGLTIEPKQLWDPLARSPYREPRPQQHPSSTTTANTSPSASSVAPQSSNYSSMITNGVSGVVNGVVGAGLGVLDVGSSVASNLWPFSVRRVPSTMAIGSSSSTYAKEALKESPLVTMTTTEGSVDTDGLPYSPTRRREMRLAEGKSDKQQL